MIILYLSSLQAGKYTESLELSKTVIKWEEKELGNRPERMVELNSLMAEIYEEVMLWFCGVMVYFYLNVLREAIVTIVTFCVIASVILTETEIEWLRITYTTSWSQKDYNVCKEINRNKKRIYWWFTQGNLTLCSLLPV